MATIRITDTQRRARLVARHHLARTALDAVDAVAGLVAMHSSDPLTPHLGTWARVDGYAPEHLDVAIATDRRLRRVHAMRGTMFVLTAEDLPVVHAAVGRAAAAKGRTRVMALVAAETDDADSWIARTTEDVLAALEGGDELTTAQLRHAVPQLGLQVTLGSGKWATRSAAGPRLLYVLAMDGALLRGRPAGTWRSSQYRWALADEPVPEVAEADARVALAHRYLATHGPVTVDDLRWWTGWTVARTRDALMSLDVTEVSLDGGDGLLLAEDLDRVDTEVAAVDPDGVALLGPLDPTPMGYKERSWYLGAHGDALFDRNGNVGPTAWAGGRVVGGWYQRPDAEVVVELLGPVTDDAADRLDHQAAELTAWLDGVVVTPRFRTPLEQAGSTAR